MPTANIKEKIAEQRVFLSRSIQHFVEGDTAEALRIATAIRVLVHETGNSKPALKHFRSDYLQLSIMDHMPPTPVRSGGIILQFIGVGVKLDPEKGLLPITDLSQPTLRMATVGQWWVNRCLLFTDPGGRRIEFRRRDLILTLANKEGGAQVDTTLPADYETYVLNSPVRIQART